MSLDYYDDSLDSDNNLPQYARITFFGQLPYTMTKERIIIGRNSAAGSVDIDVGMISFVSRKHLELTYSYQKLKVKCLGKNGIFIDNSFKSHSCIPYELPAKCTLRFPSTDVQFCVEQLVGLKSPERCRSFDRLKNSVRYLADSDESPEHKRIKIQSRDEQDVSSHENHAVGYHTIRDPICSLSDNEVEEYIHNDEDATRKLNSECDALMNDNSEENEGVLIDNLGSYSIDSGSVNNIPKEYSIESLKSNDITSTNILRGVGGQSNSRPIQKLVLSNIRYNSDYVSSNGGQIAILDQDDLTIEHGSDTQKPPYSYAQLIVQAVSTARDRQLTLNGIYNYISKNYPYFKAHDKGWQNSVRHNLSLNRYFIKVPRGQDEPGKGSFWRVDPTYENKLIAQAFRKRRLRNNASGIVTENAIVSQVLNISALDSNTQSSNTKLFSMNKSSQLTNRTSGVGSVITLKRACDISNQNGSTTFMLSTSSGLSSNTDGPKYFLTNRSSNGSSLETLSNVSTKGNNIKISSTAPVTKSRGGDIHVRSQGGNSGTLISLGGKLFSTANIKPLQIQQSRNINSYDGNSSKGTTVTSTVNPKGGSYYIISPSGFKSRKLVNTIIDENNVSNSAQSPFRRIINIPSQTASIRKIDITNGSLNKDGNLKSPIILKKVRINNNFITVKSSDNTNNGIYHNQIHVSNDVSAQYSIQNFDKNFNENMSDDEIKLTDETDSHVFIPDRDIDNSDMDHFLLSHSDPGVSALPLQEHSDGGSSPDLYKNEDDMWPEDEVPKMESLKYTIHDSIVDPECD